MKLVAFYLPQFHCIPENDDWWGKGFTEWTTTKNSKSYFNGHDMPEVPLNNNYYNLLDYKVQEEQSKLALKYGINAFCYYHYWFDGKLLLEKPMENMLKNKNIEIEFCICWANESWARTWDGKDKHILVKQIYDNDIKKWKKHFDYLLPFFKDKRYLKKGNKPIFVLYKPQEISHCYEMLEYWDNLAKQNGFSGMYYGFQHPSAFDYQHIIDKFDFGIEFEPLYTKKEIDGNISRMNNIQKVLYGVKNIKWFMSVINRKINKIPNIIDYDDVWEKIIKREPINDKIMAGAFPSWDNTPRKGYKGIIYHKSTPNKFYEFFSKRLMTALDKYNTDYVFINAWNEWGEGAHLEPDEKNKLGYLDAVKKSLDKINDIK